MKRLSLVLAALSIWIAPAIACGQNDGDEFPRRQAGILRRLNDRVAELAKQVSCVKAAGDDAAIRICTQEGAEGDARPNAAPVRQDGAEGPQFQQQKDRTLQQLNSRVAQIQRRIACVQAAKNSAGIVACPSPQGAPSAASQTDAVAANPRANLDSIARRIATHGFPSIFEAWVPAVNLRKSDGESQPLGDTETALDTLARHDVVWVSWPSLGLKPAPGHEYPILSPEFTPESMQTALRNRARLLAANPNMVILVDAHYHSAREDFLPKDSPWWMWDTQWERAIGYKFRAHRLDFSNPEFQDKVAAYCGAMVKSGIFDGCMLDWWNDSDQSDDRLTLIRKVRAAAGEKAIILGNVNQRLPTITAPYLNGVYREGFGADFFPDWHVAAADLIWDGSHLRKPVITALEGYPAPGRDLFQRMREVTTLALVFSNGSVLFTESNPRPPPEQLHNWYPFWDKSLGRPAGPPAVLDHPSLSGAYARQFEKGEVVFNPLSNVPVTVNFHRPRRSAASGATRRSFTVAPGDGDLFLKTASH
jgi:hypothetical protein